jgi:hypothetical protein
MQGPEDWRHQLGTWRRQHGWDKCIRRGRCRVGALGAGMLGMSSRRFGTLGGMLGMSSRWVGTLDGTFGLSSWWVGTLLNGVLGVSSWWVGTLDGMLCVSCRQVGVALHQTSATLDHLDKHLFALDLDRCLDENSSEQTPWINLVTPTARQAKAEACDHLRHAQRNIREFVLRPV